ncbi:MAG: type II secretion system F family protein [Acidimicrobiales bacterium]
MNPPLLLAAGVVFAVGLLVWAALRIFLPSASRLDQALAPYEPNASGPEGEGRGNSLVETSLLQRAAAATGRLAHRQGFSATLEQRLERADLPLEPGEALLLWALGTLLVGAAALVLKGPVIGLLATVFAGLLPVGVTSFLSGQRKRKFTAQLPDMLQLMSGSLRAGFSLLQGVDAVSQQCEEPMGKELRRILTEARLGRTLEDAMADCASRMGSVDFEWAVMAISIQREVGGNLAELLATVGETMVARERMRREVNALTAEGRMSAYVLVFMPIGLGFAMFALNPTYMNVLLDDPLGQIMLGGATVLGAFGYWWMRKTVDVKV